MFCGGVGVDKSVYQDVSVKNTEFDKFIAGRLVSRKFGNYLDDQKNVHMMCKKLPCYSQIIGG